MDLLGRVRNEMAFEGNVWKSYAYRFLMQLQLWWPIWVIYLQQDRGLSLTQITALDAPFLLVVILAEVPTGAVADRFGRKTSLVLGSLMFALAVYIFGIADNYPVILLSYTAWGLAQTFQSGADGALLYDSLKAIGREDDFQRINGRLWAITSLSVLIAILIGAPIAEATSLSFPVILSAGIALLAIPVAVSMHEPRHAQNEDAEPYLQMVRRGVGEAWRKPALRYVIIFSGFVFGVTFAPLIFLQPFLREHDVGIGDLGLWQAPVRAAGIVSALLAYRFVARAGQRVAFLAMPLALAACYFFLSGVDAAWAFAAFLPVGLVAGMQNTVLTTYVNRRIPSERRATMLSVQSVAGSIFLAVMEPLGGVIADTLGLQPLFLIFAAITIVVAPALLLLWNRAEAAELAEERLAIDTAAERGAVAVS